jgi:membrane associated rhomboid family serine protease
VDCVRQDRSNAPRVRSILGIPAGSGPPVVTIGFIAICLAVTLVGWLIPDQTWSLTANFGFLPAFARAEPWRAVTSMFDHAGLAHLALNMICLWMVGSFLEPVLGRWRYAALCLISGLSGSVAILGWARLGSEPMAWFQLTVGASGAIFGLFGAMVWVVRRLGGNLRGILVVLGINLVFTLTNAATVSWPGHFGGLVAGLALGAAYAFAPRVRHLAYSVAATAGAALVLALAYVVLSTGLPQ